MVKLKRVIFFDRDNTLIKDIPYNTDFNLVAIKPNVIETLQALRNKYDFIIVTNQSGVARGLISIGEVELFMKQLLDFFNTNGIYFLDYYYSPYHSSESDNVFNRASLCRKPGSILIELAAREHKIDLTQSFLVGDKLSDAEAACNAGVKPILISDVSNSQIVNYNSHIDPSQIIIISDFRKLLDVT